MKKTTLLVVIIISIISFSACTNADSQKSNNIKSNKIENEISKNTEDNLNQPLSFAPSADLSQIPEENTKAWQEAVNLLGDPKKDTIEIIVLAEPWFDNSGGLYVPVIIRNGLSTDINDLSSKIQLIFDKKVIASGDFVFSKEEFGVLSPQMSRPWNLLFKSDALIDKDIKFIANFDKETLAKLAISHITDYYMPQ